MSTSSAPVQDGDEGFNWDDDDDDDENVGASASQQPSSTSASSKFPTTPSSQLSRPSGLPMDTIAGLTHDELRLNSEFVKYVSLVSSLQELLSLREKTAPPPPPPLLDSPAPAAPVSSSSSLRPNQSASQVSSSSALDYPRPVTRPAHYPQSILWTKADCEADPDVRVSAGNTSRPPMRRAIRNEDGSVLTDKDWKNIRLTALSVARTHLYSLTTTAPQAAGMSRKKKYFKTFFSHEWAKALRKLERLAPLVSLCAGDWKADQTLAAVLLAEPPPIPPSSRESTPSSVGLTSRAGSTSHAGSSRRPSPRRVALKSSQRASKPVQPQMEPEPASKTGSKAKRRRDPSPAARTGKRSRRDEDDTRQHRPPSSPPSFLSMVRATPKSDSQDEPGPSEVASGDEHDPPAATRSKQAGKKSSSMRAVEAVRRTTTDDVVTKPRAKPRSTTPADVPVGSSAPQSDGAAESSEGSGDDDLHLNQLTRDELLGWIEGHNVEAPGKRAQKKDIIKAILTASKSEQPSKNDVEGIITERKPKRNTKAA